MNVIEVDVGKTKLFSIGQQYNNNALVIHFVNLPTQKNKYIYYKIDDIEEEIPLVSDLFIVSRPLMLHSGEVKAQIITRDENNSIVELTNNFTMRIKPSNYSGIGEDESYPDDPNVKNYFVKIDEKLNSFEELANLVQTKLDNGEFVGAQGPKGDPGEKGDPGDVTEEYRNLANQIAQNATSAQTSATNAQTSASNAQKALDDVKEFANQTKTESNQIKTDTSALKDEANTSAVNAKASENKAKEYANNLQASTDDISQLKEDLTGLQTVVDSKADASELAKTNLYLDALYKLNKGQTYDVLEQESEAYSVDVPSGAKYVGIDKVGGKSIVWNQLANPIDTSVVNGIDITKNNDNSNDFHGTISNTNIYKCFLITKSVLFKRDGRKYLIKKNKNISMQWGIGGYGTHTNGNINSILFTANEGTDLSTGIIISASKGDVLDISGLHINVFDLAQIFGSGNEPSTVEEFEAMFPDDYYPYSEPTILSSQTDRVDVENADGTISQQIPTNFPVLNSAGSVYDYIDLNEGKLYRRVGVVDLGELTWRYWDDKNGKYFSTNDLILVKQTTLNLLCNKYQPSKTLYGTSDKTMTTAGWHGKEGYLNIFDSDYSDTTIFKGAMSGVMLYYELANIVVENIDIPSELTDWLEVEAGGSITFHNLDEGKRVLIPNKETFIRKLDEVTV